MASCMRPRASGTTTTSARGGARRSALKPTIMIKTIGVSLLTRRTGVTVDTERDTHLRVRALTGRIGAELSGVDLANLNEADVAGIRRALLAHRVVFWRGQSIGAAEQIAFA